MFATLTPETMLLLSPIQNNRVAYNITQKFSGNFNVAVYSRDTLEDIETNYDATLVELFALLCKYNTAK